jgi:phosphoenolpyruvate carboxykinase (GTP)
MRFNAVGLWESPEGVPISAFIFGGRRSRLAPLVYQAFDWRHGVYVGATMSSETTAAATGAVGVVRRDPMAMIPFCGYNMADYWAHWLAMGSRHPRMPEVFHVNWFRTNSEGRFLWPGLGENLRVLLWIIDRVRGGGSAVESPIGWLPSPGAIDTSGLDLAPGVMDELTSVDAEAWRAEMAERQSFFDQFGDRLPSDLREQHALQARRLA